MLLAEKPWKSETTPQPLEEVSDGDLEEVTKKPEYKEAASQEELWKTFLERRKMQGAGDARYGNQHETGMEQDWDKAVDSETYIGSTPKKGDKHE